VPSGLLDRLLSCLGADVAEAVYDGTPPNPTEAAVHDALEAYRAHGADGIVAIGGGSSLDLGKAVALLATHPAPLAQYASVEGGAPRITPAVAPLIAIPTTAGTGSEVGRGSVIVLNDGRKLGFLSAHLLPKVALCDPELTLGLPAGLTAATGMDAMAHCIETFLSPLVNPPAEAIALDGLRKAAAYIERATRDGQDREARWNMMMAAMEGAMAFQKGLGAVHALSHPLGALPGLKLHHGTLNAVLLPAVLRFNASSVGDKMQRLAAAMGLARRQRRRSGYCRP
jgi:4-hydroxybutyrate dehydrogenase